MEPSPTVTAREAFAAVAEARQLARSLGLADDDSAADAELVNFAYPEPPLGTPEREIWDAGFVAGSLETSAGQAQARGDERQVAREDIITMLYAEAENESANGRPLGSATLRRFADLLDG